MVHEHHFCGTHDTRGSRPDLSPLLTLALAVISWRHVSRFAREACRHPPTPPYPARPRHSLSLSNSPAEHARRRWPLAEHDRRWLLLGQEKGVAAGAADGGGGSGLGGGDGEAEGGGDDDACRSM